MKNEKILTLSDSCELRISPILKCKYGKMGQYETLFDVFLVQTHQGVEGGVKIWNEGSPILLLLVDVFQLGLTSLPFEI